MEQTGAGCDHQRGAFPQECPGVVFGAGRLPQCGRAKRLLHPRAVAAGRAGPGAGRRRNRVAGPVGRPGHARGNACAGATLRHMRADLFHHDQADARRPAALLLEAGRAHDRRWRQVRGQALQPADCRAHVWRPGLGQPFAPLARARHCALANREQASRAAPSEPVVVRREPTHLHPGRNRGRVSARS